MMIVQELRGNDQIMSGPTHDSRNIWNKTDNNNNNNNAITLQQQNDVNDNNVTNDTCTTIIKIEVTQNKEKRLSNEGHVNENKKPCNARIITIMLMVLMQI